MALFPFIYNTDFLNENVRDATNPIVHMYSNI